MSVLASGASGSVAPRCTARVDDRVRGAWYVAADSTLDHRSALAIAVGPRPADHGTGQVQRLGVAGRSLGADRPGEVSGDFGDSLEGFA
jgi:hypothetical protein